MIYVLLGVKKVKLGSQSRKTEFGFQNKYGRVIYPSIGNFTWSEKKYTFGIKKMKIGHFKILRKKFLHILFLAIHFVDLEFATFFSIQNLFLSLFLSHQL
jgi:hypothetical protein